ncbi:hypothetical protein HDU87_001867 [Geranomyces variabilis]|uniref:C2H2-type domain-containing protein n=1 Tax=Geranomyces variabilis TaxID=109894 RepID=A0AAD5XP77_9FUNG|nr:hypothetical protein HDU87_001867 [Geranomyces variabilis]
MTGKDNAETEKWSERVREGTAEDMEAHNVEKSLPFTCRWIESGGATACGERSASSTDLWEHVQTHLGTSPVPVVCPWSTCGKADQDWSSHLKRHTYQKPYRCLLCVRRGFSSEDKLLEHKKVEHQSKNFNSDIDVITDGIDDVAISDCADSGYSEDSSFEQDAETPSRQRLIAHLQAWGKKVAATEATPQVKIHVASELDAEAGTLYVFLEEHDKYILDNLEDLWDSVDNDILTNLHGDPVTLLIGDSLDVKAAKLNGGGKWTTLKFPNT